MRFKAANLAKCHQLGVPKLGVRSKLASCGNPSYLNGSQDDPVCDKVPIVDASSTDAPDNDDEDHTEDEDADVEDFNPFEGLSQNT